MHLHSNWMVLRTVGLLLFSNLFMTIAWYGHLRFTHAPMVLAILTSWLLALPEYALQVPANRVGYIHAGLSAYQLKILQEFITLTVFIMFARLALGEPPQIKHFISFGLILTAVIVAFR